MDIYSVGSNFCFPVRGRNTQYRSFLRKLVLLQLCTEPSSCQRFVSPWPQCRITPLSISSMIIRRSTIHVAKTSRYTSHQPQNSIGGYRYRTILDPSFEAARGGVARLQPRILHERKVVKSILRIGDICSACLSELPVPCGSYGCVQ
jgi:hypothetical protein